MGKLCGLAERDLREEIKEIKGTMNLWHIALCSAIWPTVLVVFDLFFGKPWSKRELTILLVYIIVSPFAIRAWMRHEVAARLRHRRECRMEVKLNALLGLEDYVYTEE
jgi:hypothetical protein